MNSKKQSNSEVGKDVVPTKVDDDIKTKAVKKNEHYIAKSRSPKKRKYLNNKDLMEAFLESKEDGQMNDRLARYLQVLCKNLARNGSFATYTFKDDMQGYAMMMLVRTWGSFKPERSNNPFAFFTQCVKNSFIQFMNQEKRQRNIRDAVLVNQGLTPSYVFQREYEENKDKQSHTRDYAEDEEESRSSICDDMHLDDTIQEM